MSLKRLTPAQGVQFLREIASVVHIPNGSKMFAIYATIGDDGVRATIAIDEPAEPQAEPEPVRPDIIERAED